MQLFSYFFSVFFCSNGKYYKFCHRVKNNAKCSEDFFDLF